MKKLHIVYILTKLELGGAQKICLKLLKGVEELGAETTLISGDQGVLAQDVKKFDNVYLLDSFKRDVGFKTIWCEVRTFFKIVSYLRRLKKDNPNIVVHTHSTKAGILGRFAALFSRVKNRVHTVHGFGFNDYQPWIKWIIIYLAEFFACLITTHYVCVSYADLNLGSRILPGFKKKSSIIRAAVDWERFYTPALKKSNFGNEGFTFGTVSCLKPQKNILDLLKAFKIVLEKASGRFPRLQIIGDGAMRTEIEEWLSYNNMVNYVDLLGWQGEVSSWMKTWDVYVMSSLWEGLPCSVVEARLIHLPVIAYSVGGISEVISSDKNGYLIAPKNINDLSDKMLYIFNNPDIYKKLSSCSEDLSEFSDNFMIRKHFEMYFGLF